MCFQGSQLAINARHYRVDIIVGVQPTDTQIRDRFDALFGPLYTPLLSTTTNFIGCTVRKIHPLPVLLETARAGVSTAGTATGDPLPKQVAGVITLRSPFAGRSNRGRLYIPFPAEGSNDTDSTPTAAYLADQGFLGLGLASNVVVTAGANSATLGPVIWRRGPRTAVVITGFTGRDKWGTQRRRGDYGRPNLIPV
jgi:hypothetical protein